MIQARQIGLFEDTDRDQHSLFGLDGGVNRVGKNAEAWAVIEPQTRRAKSCVWGVGTRKEEARLDAIHWMKDWSGRANTVRSIALSTHPAKKVGCDRDLDRMLSAGVFLLLPCTSRLKQEVGRFGGEVEVVVRNGIAHSKEEII